MKSRRYAKAYIMQQFFETSSSQGHSKCFQKWSMECVYQISGLYVFRLVRGCDTGTNTPTDIYTSKYKNILYGLLASRVLEKAHRDSKNDHKSINT